MIALKKQQNIVLAQKPGDWEITIKTGSLPAKPGELTGMFLYLEIISEMINAIYYLFSFDELVGKNKSISRRHGGYTFLL